MLAKQQKNPNFAAQLQNVAARVRTGESISAAFEAQGGFPIIYTTTLLAGERSGNLEEVLSRFLSFQRISLSFRKKLQASLVYPALLMGMVGCSLSSSSPSSCPSSPSSTTRSAPNCPASPWRCSRSAPARSIMLFYVIPGPRADRLRHLSGGAPPRPAPRASTQCASACRSSARSGSSIRWPSFARTLSTLLTGGLPLVPSLETAARSISSKSIAKAVFTSVGRVREGKGLATSLKQTGIFPELSTEMIEVGESTGALPQMLNSVAEFFEEDVQTALTASLALIEPAILIIMGIVVVTILIALYLPIFSLGQAGAMQGH